MRIVSRKLRKYKENPDHTTYYNKYGEIVPSVTTVLKIIAKESLIYWANSLGWKRLSVTKELDDSSTVGTCAHNFIEAYITGDDIGKIEIKRQIECLPEELKYQVLNSIESFILWWKDNKQDFEILECEKEMSCDDFGGTADLIAKYKKTNTVIIDFKTSKAFYFTMFLQLAAYAHMYKCKHGKYPDNVAILRMDKKRGTKAEILWLTDLPNGDLDFYYISYKRALDLYKNIHILEQDWKNVR